MIVGAVCVFVKKRERLVVVSEPSRDARYGSWSNGSRADVEDIVTIIETVTPKPEKRGLTKSGHEWRIPNAKPRRTGDDGRCFTRLRLYVCRTGLCRCPSGNPPQPSKFKLRHYPDFALQLAVHQSCCRSFQPCGFPAVLSHLIRPTSRSFCRVFEGPA